jgi:hypothetical protein
MVNFLKLDNFIAKKIKKSELIALHKAKQPYMDKLLWYIVEST